MTTVSEAPEFTFEATSREVPGDQHLHYHDAGTGDTLLLLHGAGPGVSGWANFRRSVPLLSKQFRTVILDQPGFGRSYTPNIDRPYNRIASDAVQRLLDHLGIERAHLLGNSMGGATSSRFTLEHPDRVAKLVLMGAGGIGVNILGPRPSEGMKRLGDFVAEPSRASMVAWLLTMVSNPKILTDELVEERLENSTRPGAIEWMRAFSAAANDPSLQDPVPMWAEGGKIAHEVLITWGRDDRVVPLEYALLPVRQLPNVELHVFPNCGHWAMIEQQEAFERVVIEFLTR